MKYSRVFSRFLFVCILVTVRVPVVPGQTSGTVPSESLITDSLTFQGVPIPQEARRTLELFSFKNVPLKDALRSMAAEHRVNIFVDDAIDQRITTHLTGMAIHEIIVFLAAENNLDLTLQGKIYKITAREPVMPEPKPLDIRYDNSTLTVDIKDAPLEKVIYAIQEITGKNIMISRGVSGKVSGFLQDVPFETGLATLLKMNGFVMKTKDAIYIIENDFRSQPGQEGQQSRSFWVEVRDSLLYVEVSDTELKTIVRDAAAALDINMVTLSPLEGKVNAQLNGLTFDRMLDLLFKGTEYTYRKENDIYLLGKKSISGMSSIKLIKLNHLKVEGIKDTILPPDLTQGVKIQVVNEHNGLMVIGSQDAIKEIEDFIRQIDYPIPQILLEAIVVDYTTSDIRELSVEAWRQNAADTTSSFLPQILFPEVDISADGGFLNKSLKYHSTALNIANVGVLPDDFMLRLRALEQKKKANIRSNPQIATLNGNTAFISIGTTQYYQLESQTPIVGGNQAFNQISQRFEQIKAEIRLEITPWVSASGEITTVIKPKFNTPKGTFDSKTPPTIDTRELESTVRLRDGETIVLGGLIQDIDEETVDKFPFLGDIPFLGRLFRNTNHNRTKAQLMIYITPHLMISGTPNPYMESALQ